MNKIDIYGTLGPACKNKETLEQMFRLGMTGVRLNLSHVGLVQCEEWIKSLQAAGNAAGVEPKLLIDLQGPELRIGVCGGISCVEERESVILGENGVEVPECVLKAIEPGQKILLDDGKILLEAEEIILSEPGWQNTCAAEKSIVDVCGRKAAVRCEVLRGGQLKPRKSIALPGIQIKNPTLTECDWENLKVAKRYGVTGVMLPFVRSAEDLKCLKKALEIVGAPEIRIFAKIENMEGVRQLETLLPFADEIVIARGDLGNAMPLWELPKVQYEIGSICKKAGKPYMVVTQMLASMEHAAVPTRAEVSDIFYAVWHGASSVMLTGETAAGDYPVEAMEYMCRTVESAKIDGFNACGADLENLP